MVGVIEIKVYLPSTSVKNNSLGVITYMQRFCDAICAVYNWHHKPSRCKTCSRVLSNLLSGVIEYPVCVLCRMCTFWLRFYFGARGLSSVRGSILEYEADLSACSLLSRPTHRRSNSRARLCASLFSSCGGLESHLTNETGCFTCNNITRLCCQGGCIQQQHSS